MDDQPPPPPPLLPKKRGRKPKIRIDEEKGGNDTIAGGGGNGNGNGSAVDVLSGGSGTKDENDIVPKKRGRKCKEKVYKTTMYDKPIRLFSSKSKKRLGENENNKSKSGSVMHTVIHLPLKQRHDEILLNNVVESNSTPINGGDGSGGGGSNNTQRPHIDYKNKVIVSEEPDTPLTELEISNSMHKRDKETTEITYLVKHNIEMQNQNQAHQHDHQYPSTSSSSSHHHQQQQQESEFDELMFEMLKHKSSNELYTLQCAIQKKIQEETDIDKFFKSDDYVRNISSTMGSSSGGGSGAVSDPPPLSLENNSRETKIKSTRKVKSPPLDVTQSPPPPTSLPLPPLTTTTSGQCQTINFTYSEGMNVKCWWCRHLIDEDVIPFPLPTRYDQAKDKFKTTGYFCSPNCALAYNNDTGKCENNYLIIFFVRKLYDPESNINVKNLVAAPHWKTLKEYGGTLDIAEFRQAFYDHTQFEIMEYPMISHSVIIEKTTVPKTAGDKMRLKRTRPPLLARVQQTF
jgi:hypothetical protein